MENSDAIAVRQVRCPRCRGVLPEPPDVNVYKCGGCGTTLRAKTRTGFTGEVASASSPRSELPPQSRHYCQPILNKTEMAGKQIKLETSRPGGTVRNLMQQIGHDLDQEEPRSYKHPHVGSPIANSLPAKTCTGSTGEVTNASSTSRTRTRLPPRSRHCRPILKGAPFIVCFSCLDLLQIPIDFAVSTNAVGKLQCGSCSSVLTYSCRDPARKEPYQDPVDKLSSESSKMQVDNLIGEITCCESYSKVEEPHYRPYEDAMAWFTEGQFERISPKTGFNTLELEAELELDPELELEMEPDGLFLAPPTFGSDPFETASSHSGIVLKYPEKPELKPETTKLEPELVKPDLSTFPASKVFGEERETQFPVYKIPLKSEPVWEEKPLQMEPFWEESEKRLSATSNKWEPFWEEKPVQTGPKFKHAEELLSTPYKDVMAWFAMGKQTQIGRPSHACMQKAGQELLLGRDGIRQNVMEKILLDSNGINNCTVISIYGCSGLGKTSLLHVLYNDQHLVDAFDKRIWIQISEKVDMVMLFRRIIEFGMNERCSITDIDILRELVVEEITDKKFLLFLDDADIESQQFWTTVLEVLNTGAKGSVVVMATRSSTVAAVANVATHSYFLNPLSEENKLMILQQYSGVGTDIQNNLDLVMVAKRLISRFGSDPLNLKAISGLLCHADTISLEKDMFEESVMPLQLCHDVLPVHLKQCLALCLLFPEGYVFDKHHMVLLWISHGCVRPVEGYELEDVGVEYFNELLCRSFFQWSPVHSDKDDMFVMHELIYNVVASVSSDKYFKSEDPMCSIPETVLHCSLISSQLQTVELMHKTEQLKDLHTFLAVQPEWKPSSISLPTLNLVGLDDFLLKFTSLETLDLSHTETEELPGSIAGLRNLRYLSVNSTNIRALPSELCSLSNLQTLEAKHCRFLTELPRDIKTLVKLRHLDLTKELDYVHLPHGIGDLTELQTLPVFYVSEDSSRCCISELGSLHNLRGCLWLSGLESVKPGSKAQESNLKDKHRLKDLTLQWRDDGINTKDEDEDTENVADEQVLESLQPHANLQVLAIRGYAGSRFPAWMQGSSSLPNLVTLTLDNCCNCTEFPALAHLPSLKFLSVRKMYDVQRLSSNTDTHGVVKFPSLELLNLWEMYGLEELFSKESEGDCPRLHKVCISRCPNLKRLPCAPSLTELVLHCGHQLPDISELASLVSLKIEGFHRVRSFGLPAAAVLRRLEIRSCKELASVDGLSAALTTVRRIKIAGCPKLVLPGTSSLQTT